MDYQQLEQKRKQALIDNAKLIEGLFQAGRLLGADGQSWYDRAHGCKYLADGNISLKYAASSPHFNTTHKEYECREVIEVMVGKYQVVQIIRYKFSELKQEEAAQNFIVIGRWEKTAQDWIIRAGHMLQEYQRVEQERKAAELAARLLIDHESEI